MPEWMLPTLREFPVFGLVFGTVWVVVKYLDRHRREASAREDRRISELLDHQRGQVADQKNQFAAEVTRHREEVERLQAEHQSHLRSKDAEIRRLVGMYREARNRKRR